MKKIFIFLWLLILFPNNIKALSAHSYIVIDADSKRVLSGSNYHEKMLIASTSKIMTSYVALLYGNIDKEVIIGEEILKSYGSSIYLSLDEKMNVKDLLYGLMLRSGNDAAIVLAKEIANNMPNFVNIMNYTANNIGMKNTVFVNAHGLEEENGVGNISTSYDMALLMNEAMKINKFKDIVKAKVYKTTSNIKAYEWHNKNRLLIMYDYCLGGKTGFTKKASRTLVTMAEKDNKKVIIVTLKDGNDFNNHKNLYEQIFNKYNLVNIIDVKNYNFLDTFYQSNLYILENFKLLLTEEEQNKITIKENIMKKKHYHKNEIIGELEVILDNEILFKTPIYIKKGF